MHEDKKTEKGEPKGQMVHVVPNEWKKNNKKANPQDWFFFFFLVIQNNGLLQ